ncbi:MAG: hypothetical protein ACI4RD_03015 [Kiritimatiellia bacterium]
MSEQIKIAVISFGRGMANFVRPWRFAGSAPAKAPAPRGIARHFAAVGVRLSNAADRYAKRHPEISQHA